MFPIPSWVGSALYVVAFFAGAWYGRAPLEAELRGMEDVAHEREKASRETEDRVRVLQKAYTETHERRAREYRDQWMRFTAEAGRRVPKVCGEEGSHGPSGPSEPGEDSGTDSPAVLRSAIAALNQCREVEMALDACQADLRVAPCAIMPE